MEFLQGTVHSIVTRVCTGVEDVDDRVDVPVFVQQ